MTTTEDQSTNNIITLSIKPSSYYSSIASFFRCWYTTRRGEDCQIIEQTTCQTVNRYNNYPSCDYLAVRWLSLLNSCLVHNRCSSFVLWRQPTNKTKAIALNAEHHHATLSSKVPITRDSRFLKLLKALIWFHSFFKINLTIGSVPHVKIRSIGCQNSLNETIKIRGIDVNGRILPQARLCQPLPPLS